MFDLFEGGWLCGLVDVLVKCDVLGVYVCLVEMGY